MELTEIGMVTITAPGIIEVQWKLVTVRGNGSRVSENHRSAFDVDTDIDKQVEVVSAHLEAMGFPAIAEHDVELIREIAQLSAAHPVINANRCTKLEEKAAEIDKQVNEVAQLAAATVELAGTEAEAKVRSEAAGGEAEKAIAIRAADAVETAKTEAEAAFTEQIDGLKAEAKRLRRLKTSAR